VKTQQCSLCYGETSTWLGLSWASKFLQNTRLLVQKRHMFTCLLPFAHCTCLQKYCHFILRTLFSKYGRMRNISRMMVCFPSTSQGKCLPAREILSCERLPYKTIHEQNVTKCNKWLCVLVHNLLCHQASHQRQTCNFALSLTPQISRCITSSAPTSKAKRGIQQNSSQLHAFKKVYTEFKLMYRNYNKY